MSTIQDLFQQAQLAEAAYANLWNSGTNSTITDPELVQAALQDSGNGGKFTAAAAAEFVKHWRVVDQYTAPNGGSGFSGTVFESLDNPGQYVFSARGSDGLSLTDWGPTNLGDIGADGIAIAQGLDMFNYYLRLATASGFQAAQYEYIPEAPILGPNGVQVGTTPAQIVQTGTVTATGELFGQPISAVGHSLGGHLAMMLSRMEGNVGGVTTFNAPGFDSILGAVTNPLTSDGFFNLLSAATGTSATTWDPAIMTHIDVEGEAGVQGDWAHYVGVTPGVSQKLFTESMNQDTYRAHLIEPISDSLAVYNLFAKLDPNLNTDPNGLQTITDILKASSSVADRSLESAITALGKLFKVTGTTYTSNEFDNGTTGRDLLYVALDSFNAMLSAPQFSVVPTIQSLTSLDAATLKTNAEASTPEGLAHRYALLALNPFVAVGADYTSFTTTGELDLFTTTGQGQLTDQYLTDRAAMLNLMLQRNTDDVNTVSGSTLYRDVEQHITLNTTSHYTNESLQNIVFGGAGNDNMIGGAMGDRLYGMGGIDALLGKGERSKGLASHYFWINAVNKSVSKLPTLRRIYGNNRLARR